MSRSLHQTVVERARRANGLCRCGQERFAAFLSCARCLERDRNLPSRRGDKIATYEEIAAARRAMVLGYVYVYIRGHAHASQSGHVREHIAVAAAALGKALPAGAVVHHVNGHKNDNKPSNLVICQNDAYHQAIHVRLRVRARGGNPWTQRWCSKCRSIKDISLMGRAGNKLARECRRCISDRVASKKKAAA